MNNTVLERIGIDPIIIFIILILLIAVLFYLLHRQTVRYNQLKQALLHMNKVLRTQGVPARLMIGMADKNYHAWVVVTIDGQERLYDPTAAVNGISNVKSYTVERFY